jgi:hypothetical protein
MAMIQIYEQQQQKTKFKTFPLLLQSDVEDLSDMCLSYKLMNQK